MWFKVVMNKDGGVSSCEQVDGAFTDDGKHIFYVNAASATEAMLKAKSDFSSLREASRKRHAARRADGKCYKCGSGRDGRSRLLCRKCCEVANRANRERKAIRKLAKTDPDKAQELWRERRSRIALKNRKVLLSHATRQGNAAMLKGWGDARWDQGKPLSAHEKATLRQALRVYDRDPEGLREWLVYCLEHGRAPRVVDESDKAAE